MNKEDDLTILANFLGEMILKYYGELKSKSESENRTFVKKQNE